MPVPPLDEAAAPQDELRQLWDTKATYWDEQMGDGNQFQRELIGPATERLLHLKPGERILDVACGNGVFTRRLAALGAEVTGIDFSAQFIARARERATPHDARITYQVVDATDAAALLRLGEGRFDALVCNMAMMDMATITPLVQAAPRLLTPQGRFVFSVQHPAFNSNAVQLSGTRDELDNSHFAVQVNAYLTVPPGRACGMPGEPVAHWYFHRPLHELFGAFFQAGFVLNGLEEPRFATANADPHKLTWSNLPDIPPVLVARAFVK